MTGSAVGPLGFPLTGDRIRQEYGRNVARMRKLMVKWEARPSQDRIEEILVTVSKMIQLERLGELDETELALLRMPKPTKPSVALLQRVMRVTSEEVAARLTTMRPGAGLEIVERRTRA